MEENSQSTTPEQMAMVLHRPEETSLRVLLSTQIDQAISTAHAYPRNLAQAMNAIETMATRNAGTAEACRFRKPIGGGQFAEGGSIRLAEIIGVCWGNLAVDPPLVTVAERHVEAHVVCRDLQTNVSFPGSCTKSLLYSKKGQRAGQRFTEDMIATTIAATIATAKRNAILATVPRVFWEPILAKCKAIVAGTIKDLGAIVSQTLDALKAKGIDKARVLAALGRERPEDITAEDIADLRSSAEAIKSGELTLEEAFPPIVESKPEQPDNRSQAERLTKKAATTNKTPQGDQGERSPCAGDEAKAGAVGGAAESPIIGSKRARALFNLIGTAAP